jgi:dynein heavy chain
MQYLVDVLTKAGYSVLISGGTVGKTSTIQHFLQNLCDNSTETASTGYIRSTVHFSFGTTAKYLQQFMESKLEKKGKNVLAPPSNQRMLIFIDDMNMPQIGTFGVQPPLELLRQCLDSGGFYDLKKKTFKKLADTQVTVLNYLSLNCCSLLLLVVLQSVAEIQLVLDYYAILYTFAFLQYHRIP